MRPTVRIVGAIAASLVLSVALVSCGSSSGGHAAKSTPGDSTTNAPASGGSKDLCSLLTDDEVTGVIGAHSKGATGIETGALYGDDSCLWSSTALDEGRKDAVEVAVLSGTIADEARAQDATMGSPLTSFGHNARYNQSYSRLWFDCGKSELCYTRVDTASVTTHSGESRQAAAVKLGNLLLTRV